MPTTPVYALPYPAATDPADVPADVQALATRLEAVLGTRSAAPPASPTNGQRWEYPFAAAPFGSWAFRYDSALADAYKWRWVGGVPLFVEANEQQTNPAAANAWALLTNGPVLTLPRPGIYYIELGCRAFCGVASGMYMSYRPGGEGATTVCEVSTATASQTETGSKVVGPFEFNTAAVLTASYMADTGAANSSNWSRRWMRAWPVRVS